MWKLLVLCVIASCSDDGSVDVTFGPDVADRTEWTAVTPTGRLALEIVDTFAGFVTVAVEPAMCSPSSVVEAKGAGVEPIAFPLTPVTCGDTEPAVQDYSLDTAVITCTCASTYSYCRNCSHCSWYYTGVRC